MLDDVLHLFVRQVAKAGGDNHQVGRSESLQAGDVVPNHGVDRPSLGVHREEHRALEPMVFSEDLTELRQCLL